VGLVRERIEKRQIVRPDFDGRVKVTGHEGSGGIEL